MGVGRFACRRGARPAGVGRRPPFARRSPFGGSELARGRRRRNMRPVTRASRSWRPGSEATRTGTARGGRRPELSEPSVRAAKRPSWSHRTVVRCGRGLCGHSTGDDDMMGVVDGKRLRAASVSGLGRRAHRASGESVIPGRNGWLGTSRLSAPMVRPGAGWAGIVSGSCPSGRGFAPCFLRTPPCSDVLAHREFLPSLGWMESLRFRAVGHARHTKEGGRSATLSRDFNRNVRFASSDPEPVERFYQSSSAPNPPATVPSVKLALNSPVTAPSAVLIAGVAPSLS